MDFMPMTGIVVICTFVGKVLKESPIDSRWIPSLCGFVGGILGVVGMYCVPDFPTKNLIDALAVGIVSGLASTGAHQMVKQHLTDSSKQEDAGQE